MKSRYLSHLESRIAREKGRPKEYELTLEKVSCLARLGKLQDAKHLLSEIRLRVLENPSLRASVLFHIADGLCEYYTNLAPSARDRFARALALASAADQVDLVTRAASWQALVQYGSHEFQAMITSLDQCFLNFAVANAETMSRSCLLVAQALHIANRFDLALPWYRRARHYCAEVEDDITLSALMHNMASIWASNVRNASLGGLATRDSSRQAMAGVLASMNFDELIGTAAMEILTPLLRAQIESIQGNCNAAVELYGTQLEKLEMEAMKGWRAWLRADFGWNLLRTGNYQQAILMIESAETILAEDMHPDDHAATLSRLASVYLELGDPARASRLREDSRRKWSEFADLQAYIHGTLQGSRSITSMAQWQP